MVRVISRIVKVVPKDDYMLLIEFEYGNSILFNMQKLIRTMPYQSLVDKENFKKIRVEDKAICWETGENQQLMIAVRLTVDNILFHIRDCESQ